MAHGTNIPMRLGVVEAKSMVECVVRPWKEMGRLYPLPRTSKIITWVSIVKGSIRKWLVVKWPIVDGDASVRIDGAFVLGSLRAIRFPSETLEVPC